MAQSYYTACESKHLLFSYLGSCCLYSAALVKLFLQLWQFCKSAAHTPTPSKYTSFALPKTTFTRTTYKNSFWENTSA